MLESLIWLLGFQLAGELLVRGLGWPLPGPVLGMLLLFLTLCLRRSEPPALGQWVPRALQHLSLLFIPAGAALLLYQDRLVEVWARLSLVLLLSTVLTLLLPALLLAWLLRRRRAC